MNIRQQQPSRFDLTEAGARRVQAVVADANSVSLVRLLAGTICAPVWALMAPWYGYRLHCWRRLNAQFSELRNPNSFSPHGQLAAEFQDARVRLIAGLIVGSFFWIFVAIGLVIEWLA